jgi:CheY-like chemotaxis protein
VKIYSEFGSGTSVKLYFPRVHSAVDAEPASFDTIESGQARNDQILVVEDDPGVQATTVSMLLELGYDVKAAANAAEAFAQLDALPRLRLLFTDIGLPGGMNGRDLADQVKRLRPELPIIFTTGYARNAVLHHGRVDQGIHLIVKPFNLAALAAKLREVLPPA